MMISKFGISFSRKTKHWGSMLVFVGVYYTYYLHLWPQKKPWNGGISKKQLKMWSEVSSFLSLVLASFKFLILSVTQNRHALPNHPKSSQILLKNRGKPRFWQNQWIGMSIFCQSKRNPIQPSPEFQFAECHRAVTVNCCEALLWSTFFLKSLPGYVA